MKNALLQAIEALEEASILMGCLSIPLDMQGVRVIDPDDPNVDYVGVCKATAVMLMHKAKSLRLEYGLPEIPASSEN